VSAIRSDHQDHARVPSGSLGTGGTVALIAFLFFLGFPARVFVLGHHGAAHVVLVAVALVAFVGIYLRVMLVARSRQDTVGSIAAMAVLAAALSADGSAEWATSFIYVSAAAGLRLPVPHVWRVVVAATVATAAASFGHGYPVDDSVSYVLYALAIGALLRGYAELVRLNLQLRLARDEIARLAVTEERLRFARDLHDLLGHSLSVIALKSELARRVLGTDPDRASQEIGEIEQVSRDALVDVREAVGGYRRMTLSDELRGAAQALDAAGIEATIRPPAAPVSPDVEGVLAWAVREGTTNVIRHSGARRCVIQVHAGPADAGVEILDDGSAADQDRDPGSGLAGLEERVRMRAGRLESGHRPEGGFRLAVRLPVHA
jgi:two-component system sensor histidine kinase DesK